MPRKKRKIICFKYFVQAPIMSKLVLDLNKVKQNKELSFSSFFAFKRLKKTSPPPLSQAFWKILVIADFRETVKIYWQALRQVKKPHGKWNFGIGVQRQCGTTCVQYFFLKFTPPYRTVYSISWWARCGCATHLFSSRIVRDGNTFTDQCLVREDWRAKLKILSFTHQDHIPSFFLL